MHNRSFRRPYISLVLPFILAACAGGGGVNEPEVFVERPTLQPFDAGAANVKKHADTDNYFTVSTNGGAVEKYTVTTKEKSSWSDSYYDVNKDVTVYKTPDGKYYQFGNFNTPVVPDNSSPSKKFLTSHEMQSTTDGGKIFACCDSSHTYRPAIDMRGTMYYGAWISPKGEASLFAGGSLADAAYMQGGSEAKGVKGKATYDVWGIRVKDGKVVSSSYTPKNPYNADAPTVISQLTVNFNTGKLGGEIIGNKDFGDSVVMKDVNVNGNKFSGTAISGNATGQVEGAFFGAHRKSYYSDSISEYGGRSIGGTVKFDGNKSLDTAFGGTRTATDLETKSTDLTPLK